MYYWLTKEEEEMMERYYALQGCGCHNPNYWCPKHEAVRNRAIMLDEVASALRDFSDGISFNDFVVKPEVWSHFIDCMKNALDV